MVSIEEFRAFQLVCAKDRCVHWVSLCVPFHGRSVEDIGQVEVLLPSDFRQVSFGLVYSLCQAQLLEVFLRRNRNTTNIALNKVKLLTQMLRPIYFVVLPAGCD